jgi:hypothetical protein
VQRHTTFVARVTHGSFHEGGNGLLVIDNKQTQCRLTLINQNPLNVGWLSPEQTADKVGKVFEP